MPYGDLGCPEHVEDPISHLGVDTCTCQLAVICFDAISCHGSIHGGQCICGHLMPQTPAPTMKHDTHLDGQTTDGI
jgi:hypothetical protein